MLPLDQQTHYAELKLESQMLFRTIYDEIKGCNDIDLLKQRFCDLLSLHLYRKQVGDQLIGQALKDSFESRLSELQNQVDQKPAHS